MYAIRSYYASDINPADSHILATIIRTQGGNTSMSLIRQIKSILTKNDSKSLSAEQPAQVERRRQKRYSHKGRRILIIDDSPTVVASLGKILRSAGCLVAEAGDAA